MTFCISSVSSNSGKTVITLALLYHFRKRVRAYKIGPDFIDPQFHKRVCGDWSVNLDSYMLDEKELIWTFQNYKKEVNILEGVMGYYDGMDKKASCYDVTKILKIPTILVLNGSGSYITVVAVLKGLLEYQKECTIKGVILNRLSSKNHYELIKSLIEKEFKDIVVLGWVKKDLESLREIHLGLDLDDMQKLESISKKILKNLELEKFLFFKEQSKSLDKYPFEKLKKVDKTLTIVYDKNFSFLYYDNLCFLKEVFKRVIMIDSTKDEEVPEDADIVYIPGGYVESESAYKRVKESVNFKNSLIKHSKSKPIYAECAGMLYLGKSVDEKKFCGILPIKFSLQKRFVRLGYYQNELGIKGHCFHYTKPKSLKGWFDKLSKNGKNGEFGSYALQKVFGTYLHTIFRANVGLVKERFLI
jgi:cobyrinic acid a,c-diamide synthase